MGWFDRWRKSEAKETAKTTGEEEKGRFFPPKKEQFFVLLLIGLLMMVIVWPSDTSSDTDEKGSAGGTETENGKGGEQQDTDAVNAEEYAEYLEERLQECLSAMDGVGQVKVFVTLKSSEESVLAKDKSSTGTVSGSEGEMSDLQTDEETVYTDGENGQTPYVVKELTPTVRGVLVVAEGGDDPVVRQNISEAVEALFSIESHKIKVVRMKEG